MYFSLVLCIFILTRHMSVYVTVHSFSCGFEAWDGNGMEWGQWDGEIKSVPIETGVLSRRRKPAQHG